MEYTYKLIWHGEVIDEFETLQEAERMAIEYRMAYHDEAVTIDKQPKPNE